MKTHVQKWGNSLAVRIPKPYALEIGLDKNIIVDVSVSDGRIVLEPVAEPKYTLAQLLAQITDANLHAEVRSEPAVGNETW